MTAVTWGLLIGAYLVCLGAARRIAVAKKLPGGNWTLAVLLLGPLALTAVAFAKPADAEEDRLGWWRTTPDARPWGVLGGLAVAVTVGVIIYSVTRSATYDSHSLAPQIVAWLADNGAPGATVDCPDSYPGEAGYTFLCTATDASGTAHVQVTVLNDKGEVQWVLIG